MKLWTGDSWRPLSPNEAKYRIDNGFVVLEDDDPRTLVNERPAPRVVRAVEPAPVVERVEREPAPKRGKPAKE